MGQISERILQEDVSTKNMSRQEWLKLRQTGIGGSDAGTILGINKWKSPIQLYFEKTQPELKQEIDNEYIYWGNVLEDVVAKEFTERTGKKVRKVNKMFRHPKYNFMLANIDRAVVGEKAVLECKTTSEYNKEAWKEDEIPDSYIAQVQHYMAVTGYEKGYIAVLIGGNKFIWKEIERDEELINIIIQEEKYFWENYILGDDIPPVDGSVATTEFMKFKYQDSVDTQAVLDENDEMIIKALNQIKEEEKELKEQKAKYENQIKNKLGENHFGISQNYQVLWKPQKSSRFDRKKFKEEYPELDEQYTRTTESRVMRIKEVKG
ncbi:YqaJ viral recombinase family protein [Mammaliicoccus sciuri]|uniref:YqaJ viral recombinase family nuclease n=1 Tax=Mammaliicoccus sciuri TaxID=1296 RepID=UPI003F573D32